MSNDNSSFTAEQISLITTTLDELCPVGSGECVARPAIFTALDGQLDGMKSTKFQNLLSALLRNDEIPGFAIRVGAGGGAYRVADVKKKVPTKPKRAIKTHVEIDGDALLAYAKAEHLKTYILTVLDGKQDDTGSVVVGDVHFACDSTGFKKYLSVVGTELPVDSIQTV